MARFFIDRPVFAIVLAIIITLLGTIAGFSLPIAQYPNITKPRISVNTNYVGASADIVEKAVAQTIEQKVSGVENMLNMSSVSTSSGDTFESFLQCQTILKIFLRIQVIRARRNYSHP